MFGIQLLKNHRTFWEEVQFELKDMIETIQEFFIMIKENTYDALVARFGAEAINILLLGIIVVLIMLIALKLMNHD